MAGLSPSEPHGEKRQKLTLIQITGADAVLSRSLSPIITYTTEIKTGVFHDMPLPDFVRRYDDLVAKSETLCQVFTNTDSIRAVFDIDCAVASETEMHAAATRFTDELIPQFAETYFPGAKYNLLQAIGKSNDPNKLDTPFKASFHLYFDGIQTKGEELK
jgi:hypothetical protein